MLKKLMITAALSGLVIGAAAAEGMSPSSPATRPATPPAAIAPAPNAMPSSAQFINLQRPDQFLASKFKGTDVIGTDNEKIGDVSDILFDKSGKIDAYVVGVGGFLGIGSKDVALSPSSFQVVPGDKSKNEADKLRLSMTKDQLKQAANFEAYNAPRNTTGIGGSGTSAPRTVPATPAPAPSR